MANNKTPGSPKAKVLTKGDNILMALSFLPIVNSVALFNMNNKAPYKKWKRNAWIFLFANILLFISFFTFDFVSELNFVNVPNEPVGRPDSTLIVEPKEPTYGESPDLNDYIPDYDPIDLINKKYDNDSRYLEYKEAKEKYDKELEEYKNSDEYKKAYAEYKEAYKQYEKEKIEFDKAVEKYESTPAYKAYQEAEDRNDRIQAVFGGIAAGLFMAWVIVNPVAGCYVISQRRRYILMITQDGNRDAVMSKLGKKPVQQHSQPADRLQDADFPAAPPVQTTAQPSVQNAPAAPQAQPAAVQQSSSEGALDINSATEEQLSSLPGLTIIDARRAITYRDENGGFKTTDEFFTAISAKPHIMVRVEPLVTVSEVQPAQQSKPHEQSGSRRTIDL